jgi:hypothetical protein
MSAEPILGMYRGSVSNNQDPLNEARVTLLIPQVLGSAESAWAVPASPTNTVPPVGQTLWVQFSGGDLTKPVYSPLGIKDVQDAVDSLPTGDSLDGLPPKEPTALTLTSVQYVTTEGSTLARIQASWTAPTENQDGTNLTDLSHYVLQFSYDGTNWSGGQVTQDTLVVLDGLHTGVDVTVRVQAVDNSSNASLWASAHITSASSSTPPPVPSAPGVTGVLGGLRVTWDGKDASGFAMPAIFSHVQVQRDTDPAFSNPVVVGTLPGPDFLYDSVQNYASAYNYRLVAYSKVAIASAPSGANSGTAKQAGTADIAANSVTANQMAVGTLTAESGIIASLDASKMTVGRLTASQIDATGLVISGGNVSGPVASATTANTATSATSASSATTVTGSIGAGVTVPAGQLSNGTIPTTTTINGGSIKTGTIDASLASITNLDASSIKAGTLTVDKMSAGLQGMVGQKFYDFGTNAPKWKNGNSTGTMTSVSVTDAASGGTVMRATGYIQGAYRPDLLVPFDPNVTYRVTCRVRQTVDNSTPGTNQSLYAGVTGIAADGVTLVNFSGSNTVSSQFYVAAQASPLTTGAGWVTYTGYIKGTSSTPTGNRPALNPTAPATLHQNVKYISPCLYLNYTAGTGTAEMDMFTIEVVETGQVNSANINLGNVNASHLSLGTVSGNLVTNPGFEDVAKAGWTSTTSNASNFSKIEVGAGVSPARSGQGKAALGAVNTGWAKITSDPFPVVAASTYMFRYWYFGSGGLQVTFETSPDKVTWTDQMAGANNVAVNNTSGYTEDLYEMTAPTGALWGRISFTNNSPATNGLDTTTTWWLCIDDVLVMREGYGATDISAAGVRLYGPDGTLSTELTTSNAYATFAGGKASIDPNGVGTFNSVWTPQRPDTAASDDPTGQIWYQGKELSDLLWNMPWGMVSYERGWTLRPANTGTTQNYYTTDTGLIELAFTAVEGRMYRVVARSQFDFNGGTGNQVLENRVTVAATATTLNGCTIWSPTGASPKTTDPAFCRHFGVYYDGGGTDGTTTTEGIIVCSADAGGQYSSTTALAPGDHRILWVATQHSGNATGWGMRNYGPTQSSDFYVEDIGPAIPEGGVYNTGGAAVTAVKTYTKTYKATWSRRFGNAGYTDGAMYQGYYSSTWGTQKSMVGFGTQPYTDMGSTAKVSKVEIYLYANHWYYNGGGTAHIGVHTQTSAPTSNVSSNNLTVSSWPVGAGKWVTLPSSWNSGWNGAGPYRGVTLGGDLGSSTSKTYYGIFDGVGDSHPPQLRITYTK